MPDHPFVNIEHPIGRTAWRSSEQRTVAALAQGLRITVRRLRQGRP